jgi:hypothetical protein
MAGISNRAGALMQKLLPKLEAVAPQQESPAGLIDLSSAENSLLRRELQEILGSDLEKLLSDDVPQPAVPSTNI